MSEYVFLNNQLIEADHTITGLTDETYEYDDNGNRTEVNQVTWTTGPHNRLTSDGTYAYLYDAEGNRRFRFVDDDSDGAISSGDTDITEYEWDHRNRLTKVTHYTTQSNYASGTADKIVEYAYDHQNRWVRKIVDPDGTATAENITSTIFVYDGTANSANPYDGEASRIALRFETEGTTTVASDAAATDLANRYLWMPDRAQILADEQVGTYGTPGEVLWTLLDQIGSVRDVVDNAGVVRIHRVFDAFGQTPVVELRNASNVVVNPGDTGALTHLLNYTGRPLDADTGLQNHGHRWYDPLTRWLSPDPIGFEADDVNLYRYVFNQVTTSTDSTGLGADSVTNSFWQMLATGRITAAISILKDVGLTNLAARGGVLPFTGLLQRIYQQYPPKAMQCKTAATLTCRAFRAAGDKVTQIGIRCYHRSRYWNYGKIRFSESGYHRAVYHITNRRVYDALTGANGMPLKDYVEMLRTKVHITPVISGLPKGVKP